MRTSSTIIGIGLAVASLAVMVVETKLGTQPAGVQVLAVALAGVLWIAAGAAFIDGAPVALHRRLRLGLLVYGLAFVLPSAVTVGADGVRQSFVGFQAFHLALIFVTQVWLANPLYLAGLALARHGRPIASAIAIGVALVIGLSLGSVRPEIQPGIGYVVWLVGMALGGLVALADRFGRRPAGPASGS